MRPKGEKDYKYHFMGSGASDDLGSLEGGHHEDGEPVDEYDAVHHWFELKLNGEVIGECMMNFDHGWEFLFRSDTHELKAGELLCRWNGEPYEDDD